LAEWPTPFLFSGKIWGYESTQVSKLLPPHDFQLSTQLSAAPNGLVPRWSESSDSEGAYAEVYFKFQHFILHPS
jgi:hypothetical protein